MLEIDTTEAIPESTPQVRRHRLRISEIFRSLQGEGRYTGTPTSFVRLTGCPLRCSWCDTSYAFHGGRWMDFRDIAAALAEHKANHVCVTGGEPLVQPDCSVLMEQLCDMGYAVSLETSGAMDVSTVDERVSRVLDIKTPGSGECSRNMWSNLSVLTPHDQIKFVVRDREDFCWARDFVQKRSVNQLCDVWFSPVHDELRPADLADWILNDRLDVRMQIQLHKYLWGDVAGR